jgi:hypothetical protein
MWLIVKKTKAELREIAKKAVRKRQKNVQHRKSQEAGKKAWRETIRPSEYAYIEELVKKQEAEKSQVFHHEGFPDLMTITSDGKMRFFEVKPKKGSFERKMLNPRQAKTIGGLLKLDFVEVNLVKYEKQGKHFVYDEPIRLTRSNIREYSTS